MKKNLSILFTVVICLCSCNVKTVKINDAERLFSQTASPVSIRVKLSKQMQKAEEENRLALSDPRSNGNLIHVQAGTGKDQMIVILTAGATNSYTITEMDSPAANTISVRLDNTTGQYIFEDDGKPVLQYNYKTVYEKDVLRLENKDSFHLEFSPVTGVYLEEYLKENPKVRKDTDYTTSIYSIPRSDYIHPLYGLNGEILTRDWPDGGHPHHRGIFWAWPEVELGSQRGDLYALQRVFARPTGKVAITDGPVYAQLVAENLWMWENVKPIVSETSIIRVYHATSGSRVIDLAFKLEALEDSITIATRGTNSYGAFNVRMQTPTSQEISYFTDEAGSVPLRTWADFSGLFKGSQSESGLMVLQHKNNPEYPGPWLKYPELSWIQPVFPAHGTRYPLKIDKPLILRYRLIIHSGTRPEKEISEMWWDAFNSDLTPMFSFAK